jgi:putative redox protein
MALNVTIHSVEGERYTQVIESGQHVLVADQPKEIGGTDKGPGPHTFLLAALGT